MFQVNSSVVLASSFLTLNKFHTSFWCFHCVLGTTKCRLGYGVLLVLNTFAVRQFTEHLKAL